MLPDLYHIVIFDLDGTVVEDNDVHHLSDEIQSVEFLKLRPNANVMRSVNMYMSDPNWTIIFLTGRLNSPNKRHATVEWLKTYTSKPFELIMRPANIAPNAISTWKLSELLKIVKSFPGTNEIHLFEDNNETLALAKQLLSPMIIKLQLILVQDGVLSNWYAQDNTLTG